MPSLPLDNVSLPLALLCTKFCCSFQVLAGKQQHMEFAGNLVPVTKSGEQLAVGFIPFQENRLAFAVRVSLLPFPLFLRRVCSSAIPVFFSAARLVIVYGAL